MATRHLVLILGDQLNLDNPVFEDFDPTQDVILMVEAIAEATQVWCHKARITLFLSGMRHFHAALEKKYPQHLHAIYLKIGTHPFPTLQAAWAHYLHQLNPQKILICEPGEYRIEQALIKLCEKTNTPLVIRDDTHFMCSKADFMRYAQGKKELRMEFFYRKMREKFQILMAGNKPIGDTWNFDAENRKPFGKAGPQNIPNSPTVSIDTITKEVINVVQHHFPNHPGSLEHFIWPVTREDALAFLRTFIRNKLSGFGDHQDAMWQMKHGENNPYLWHSLLASSLNLKLLNPREVIAAAETAYNHQQCSLASVEGFIRQILGWREFIRGVYWLDMPKMSDSNHYNHSRALPTWYWTGNTQMNCMRQTVRDTFEFGYAHHIQRLMITGMFGILAELNPREVEAWYLAAYVDAVEWVELPNVAGMALYANGGRFTSKPYIASGAYIKRMSNYCNSCKYKPESKTGPTACPTTTLYWYFLINHYDTFNRNPRTALMTKNVDKLDNDEITAIKIHAQSLLNNINSI